MRLRYLVVLAAVAVVGCLGFSRAGALTISPAKLTLTGDPGQTLTGQFLLVNEEATGKTFFTSAENFEAQGESGTPNFLPGNDGLAGWIKVPPQVDLKPGEQKTISFSVTIPKNADPGGHFAAIFLSSIPPQAVPNQVAVGSKIGMLMLLRVSGTVKEGGGILEFAAADHQSFFTSLPVDFFYRFQNSGGDRVDPNGEISIRNMIGVQTALLPANEQQGNVLPDSVRRFGVRWGETGGMPQGLGFFGQVRYQWAHFAFGRYKATLTLHYGQADAMTTASQAVWIFPWQLLLVIFVLMVITLWILTSGIRKYNRWIVSKASTSGNSKEGNG